jgi:outer membrane receptor protein involved in Fe transport
MKNLLLLLLSTLLSTSVFAENVTIKGQLVSTDVLEGVAFATVSVFDKASPDVAVQRFATDIDGEFSTSLYPGTYIFTFHMVGMAERNKTVEVSLSQNPHNLGIIEMEEDATVLGEISVVAQRPLVRVEIDRLTYDVQADPEAATSNVLDMMRRVPLLTVDGEDNIQLRGSSNFRIHLNGRPSNMISNNPREVLRSMPASNILRIEVITDPGARYDAEGVGGIINIVTNRRVDDGYQGTVGARGDTFGGFSGNASLNVRRGQFGFSSNFSHSESRWPGSTFESERNEFEPLAQNTLINRGGSDGRGGGTWGNAMLTFEPDTLNLFTTSFNLSGFRHAGDSYSSVLSKGTRNFSFNQNNIFEGQFNNWSLNIDYQRGFRRNREELLTFSYRWQNNPNSNISTFEISDAEGDSHFPTGYRQRMVNNSHGSEHTLQVDYINPLSRRHVIETGARIIFRHNDSDGESLFFNPDTDVWQELPAMNTNLDHRQQVSSAYVGYMFRADRFSIRAGLRAEHTDETVAFADEEPFGASYFSVIPSSAVSFQIRPTTTLRFNYGMRIRRPGIWELNPFRFSNDPTTVRYGNPDLEPENAHNFSLTFGHFAPRFNINASLHYNFSNNVITWYQFIEDGVSHHTVGNIGSRQDIGFHLHGSWNPITPLRMNLNGGLNYTDMQGSTEHPFSNSGFRGNFSSNITYTLPRDWRLGASGGYSSGWIGLQSRSRSHHWHSFSATKGFMERRLDVSLNIISPFQGSSVWRNESFGEGFTGHSRSIGPRRSATISVSYRFGELRSSMRRIQRSIHTDDVMQGGGQGGGEGGGQQ